MGARLVQDINPEGSSSPNELISLNGLLFFSAELEEGKAANTSVNSGGTDSSDGGADSDSSDSAADDDATNTTTSDGSVGLIRSDGSSEGTTILKAFDSVTNLVTSGDQLYFIAGIDNQYQLWTSDGTTRGTKQVKDLNPNADPNFPQDLFEIDGVLFYSAIDGDRDGIDSLVEGGIGNYPYVNGYEVWRREGTGVGSRFFRNLIPDKIITEVDITDEEVTVLDENGQPVMVETGEFEEVPVLNPDGTQVVDPVSGEGVTRFVPATEELTTTEFTADVTTNVFANDSYPQNFTGLNGNYFFTAQSSAFYSLDTRTDPTLIGGLELWFSDGTEEGTQPININENVYTFYEPEDGEYTPSTITTQPEFGFIPRSSSSFPRELTPSRNKLYFVANDGISGFELWSISDQGDQLTRISDLNPGNTSSSPEELTMVGKNLYFSADDGSGRKLFYYNRTLDEPKVVKRSGDNPENLAAIGNQLFYSAESDLGRELWSAKKANAELVKDINPGSESSSPSQMTMTKRISGGKSPQKKSNILYFSADDGSHGVELMSLELKGKRNKVTIDSDIINGPPSSFPRELTNHNQQLYFTAKDQSKGRELWTIGPAIQGPNSESGSSSAALSIPENETFVYQFSTNSSKDTTWRINGGIDAESFKINADTGALSFKSAPDFEKPSDKNKDNTYEVYVRSSIKGSGYKSDQYVAISVSDINENPDLEADRAPDEILYYTEACGAMTANGPLNPCETNGTGGGNGFNNSSANGQILPPSNINLTSDGRQNYNKYNEFIDEYSKEDDCDYVELAKGRALLQLDYEDDDTLAKDWNRNYANECGLSEIII